TLNETSYRRNVGGGSATGPFSQSTMKPLVWGMPLISTPAPDHTSNFSRIPFSVISIGEDKSDPLIVILSVGPLAVTIKGTHAKNKTAVRAAFMAISLLVIIRLAVSHGPFDATAHFLKDIVG